MFLTFSESLPDDEVSDLEEEVPTSRNRTAHKPSTSRNTKNTASPQRGRKQTKPQTSQRTPQRARDLSSSESPDDNDQSTSRRQRSSQRAKPSPQRKQPAPAQLSPQRRKPTSLAPPSTQRGRSNVTQPPKGAARRKQVPPLTREMIKLQQSTNTLIPRLPFSRLIRELIQKQNYGVSYRITPEALEALQVATEYYITGIFSDAYRITSIRKQVTLQPRDVQLLLYLRGPNGMGGR